MGRVRDRAVGPLSELGLTQEGVSSMMVSIVIPAHNAEKHLATCLAHLAQSTSPPDECIVVDDGSTDNTAQIASEWGATVISTGCRCGPAFARNFGSRVASGDILLFLDSDVCVHPDTIARILSRFREDPSLDAVMGSYDNSPAAPDILSQYRNLMHCFVHQNSRDVASTFWAGCGGVRADVFREHGGFDESYSRPAIEDIELGVRMVRSGHKLVFAHDVRVKHLKTWAFADLLMTDIFHRGVPWTELILRERNMPNDLNLTWDQRVCVGLASLMLVFAVIASLGKPGQFLVSILALVCLGMASYWVQMISIVRSRGTLLTLVALLATFSALTWRYSLMHWLLIVILAYGLLWMRQVFFSATIRRRRITGCLYALYAVYAAVIIAIDFPRHWSALAFSGCLSLILVINVSFYRFLSLHTGHLYTLAVIPFHIMYYLSSAFSFTAGAALYCFRRLKYFLKELTAGSTQKDGLRGPVGPAQTFEPSARER